MNGKPYIYKDGYYKLDEDCNALRFCIKQLIFQDIITINRIDRVLRLILTNYRLKKELEQINNYPDHWINFKNGMFDVKEWKMHQHSPEYYSINQIPHSFSPDLDMTPNKGASVIEEFLNTTVPDPGDRKMFLQFMGYCLLKDTSMQKYLTITGPGGTGKSTWIEIIEYLVGNENISSLSLQDLNRRFYPTNLMGKLLNSCADIPKTALEETDIIKKITGQDRIQGEYKGGMVFFFKSYAKLMFSANELPRILDEKSNAFYRRMLILRIEKKGKFISNLKVKLKKEVLILLQMAVLAVREMYQEGCIFESDNSKENVLEVYKDSDTVTAFLDEVTDFNNKTALENEKTAPDTAPEIIERVKLYQEYEKYCLDNERQALSRNGFYKNLRNKGVSEVKRSGTRYFKGLKFKDTEFEPAVQTPFTGQ